MRYIEHMEGAQRRKLALGLLVGAILLVLFLTVLPVALANMAANEKLEDLHGRLVRLQQISNQDEELHKRYLELRRSQSILGYFIEGESEAVGSAELQRILKSIATQNGAQLTSTQILPATAKDSLTRIALRVRVRGPLPGLVQSLYELEANPVPLFLDNVSLRRAASVRQRLRTQAQSNSAFEADFDLIAYMAEIR